MRLHYSAAVIGCLLLMASAPPSSGEEIPEAYASSIAPLLTPAETALGLPGASGSESDLDVVLNERIYRVENDGSFLAARHLIFKPLTEDGVGIARKPSAAFNSKTQRAWIVRGQTTHPERGTLQVGEEAIFTEKADTPGEGIHSDRERIRAVLPDVVVGSTTESIIVIDHHRPTIPDEFTTTLTAGYFDAARRQRIVIDMPEEMAARLRSHSFGDRLPEPVRRETEDGRVLIEWQSDRVPKIHFEQKMPSPIQVGPAISFSTLADWDAFGAWFGKTMHHADSEIVDQLAAEWGGEDGARRAVAASLFRHVRDEIRYTGLEFGRGAHYPRDPATVVDTRFGDCKDQSNLLRALLQKRGIQSWLVLLDTDHAGKFDKTLPSTRPFDHAILAVDLGGDQPIFCDPTSPGVAFGTLSPRCCDRDVLLVAADGETRWARTPPAPPARSEIKADLELEPGGGLSGWVDYQTGGFFGGVLHSRIETEARPTMTRMLGSLAAGLRAEVIDYEVVDFTPATGALHFRFYVVKTGAPITGEAARERVQFPIVGDIFPPAGEERQRRTPMFDSSSEVKLRAEYKLPEGWSVLDLPGEFDGETDGFSIRASWAESGDRLSCEVDMVQSESLFEPNQHTGLWDLRKRLIDWLGSPALCKRGAIAAEDEMAKELLEEIFGSSEGGATTWTPAAGDLPLLPTPEGQSRLISLRYPIDMMNLWDADHQSRRIAFQRMAEKFPDNPDAQFEAGLAIIMCDVLEFEFDGVAERTEKLVARWRDHLGPEKIILAELGLASTMLVAERLDEALEFALRIRANPGTNQLYRQAAAGIASAAYEYQGRTAEAAEMAREAISLKLQPPESFSELALILLRAAADDPTGLRETWAWLNEKRPDMGEVLREAFLTLPEILVDWGQHERATTALEQLGEIVLAEDWGEEANDELALTREAFARIDRYRPLVARLNTWLEKHPWPDLEKLEEGDSFLTSDDLEFLTEDYWDNYEVYNRYYLRSITAFGSQPDFAYSLDDILDSLDEWIELADDPDEELPEPPAVAEALIDQLIALRRDACDEEEIAGADTDRRWAGIVARREGDEAAIAVLEKVAGDAGRDARGRVLAIRDIAQTHLYRQDYPARLRTTKRLEAAEFAELTQFTASFILRDAYLALALDQPAEAWRRFQIVAKCPPDDLGYAVEEGLLQIIKDEVARHGADGLDAWKAAGTPGWLGDWQQLRAALAIELTDPTEAFAPADDYKADPLGSAEEIREEFEYLPEFVDQTMNLARWHPAYRHQVAAMLRGPATEEWPEHASRLRALADQMEQSAEQPD